MSKITIGDYLLSRLKELEIDHIFGVPGDYNLGFLDQVINYSGIDWVGACNELNASYASDGYARIRGAAALLTTFGVGELSAINGIAGAYAEYIPLVNLVGMPASTSQAKKSVLHHTLGDGRFSVFMDMQKDITVAQTVLTLGNAAAEIDRVLTACWQQKRPVYIGIPSDISYLEIDTPAQPLNLNYPPSNQDAVTELVERAARVLEAAKAPVILIDICAQRHPMKAFILELLAKTGIPFANMNMGKAIISETHPQFIGNYSGDYSALHVQEYVEKSDCVITFGLLMTDFNAGLFTAKINVNVSIELHSNYSRVKQSTYQNVIFQDVIPALIHRLDHYHYSGSIPTHPQKPQLHYRQGQALTQQYFWDQITPFVESNAIVLAEAGTSMFGTQQMLMPENATYIAQTLWASIGYTLGALLGVCVAAPERPAILFIGDGSFQLTAQEVSTLMRHQFHPTIFLLDNDGYTVERVIHGPTMVYNDIQHWNYSEFPKIFGDKVWSIRISTEQELEQAWIERQKHQDQLAFITVVMDRMDAPEILIKIGKAVEKANQYN